MINKAIIAGLAGFTASITAGLPDANTFEAVGKWPLTIVLGAVCCFCVWIIYKQGADFRKSIDKLSESNALIARLLAERPCIRERRND